MTLIHRLAFLLLSLAIASPGAVAAQAHDPEGSWAVLAEGRILLLLELRRDAEAPGGWTGALVKPDQVTIRDSQLASEVRGPIVRRPLLGVAARGDSMELSVEGPEPGGADIVLVFRTTGPDAASLGWRDVPLDPLFLSRAPAGAEVAADWDSARTYLLAVAPRPTNPEMTALFEADQAARAAGTATDWSGVAEEDASRRARTRQLLDSGALESGDDYLHAAFVFQHGSEPDDYLMAHTLALVATARGRPDATWIAAASLDRYLRAIGRKQIYGTQFLMQPGQPTTQEPYDRTLVSDALRRALGVPSQDEQERQRAGYDAQAGVQETQTE